MQSIQMQDFTSIRGWLRSQILTAPKVKTERWQGVDVSKNPAAISYEMRNVVFECPLNGVMDLDHWRRDCNPNLPWADDHFLERVGGEPLNPGEQWARWPWATSADGHRMDGQFNHTYMERLWPKYARMDQTKLTLQPNERKIPSRATGMAPHRGIAWNYGDLQNFVELLATEPFTRQAYIPLFFPEDTGHGDGGRKPCTLGYQVLVREEPPLGLQAHIWYPLRSCDLVRHFPDDCYLAVRLLVWIVEQCRIRNPFWNDVLPGSYAMHMTSLHIFENDKRAMLEGKL